MNIIPPVPPGSGKGTQARCYPRAPVRPAFPPNLLRAAVRDGTPLGKKAQGYMTRDCSSG